MTFLMIWTPADEHASEPPPPALMAALGGYFAEVGASTVLAGGLLPLSQGGRVEAQAGEVVVTDGPFAEAKEVVAGVSVVDVDTKEEALALAERFVRIHADHGWGGVCEVRPFQVSGPPAG